MMLRRKQGPLLAVFSLLFGLSGIPAAGQGWSNGYAYRRTITINHNQVPITDQIGFPVLISGTYPYLATAANGGNVTSANGYDIIFTSDPNGVNVLPFEQEAYNASTGAIVYWVQIPMLLHATDTVFYLFYGNSSVATDQSNKTGVWDSNYVGVWHLSNQSGLNSNDSTGNGNNGTNNGATTTAGQVDGAASFNGSSNIALANAPSLNITGNMTAEAWAKTSATGDVRIISHSFPTSPWNGYEFGIGNQGYGHPALWNGTAWKAASISVNDNRWHLIAVSVNGNGENFYVDGASAGSATGGPPVSYAGVGALGYAFSGSIDEIRLSNVARSSSWLAAEYNNQSSPSTFYTIAPASNSTYAYGRAITIAHSQVPNTDLTNFPVLISGTYPYLATTANGGNVTNANGYDIIFTADSAGSVLLPFEQEAYDPSTGAVIYWVKLPTVWHNTDTAFYMFYGNSSVTTDQSNKVGVWDANYVGVWHLPNGSVLAATDSTSNGNSGTNNGASPTTGKIDGAASFNGSSSISLASASSMNITGHMTAEAWIKTSATGDVRIVHHSSPNSPWNGYEFGIGNPTSGRPALWDGAAWLTANASVNNNTWHAIAVSVTDVTTNFYIDGASAGSVSGGPPNSYSGSGALGTLFTGSIDEIRLSNISRSSDWVATEYHNESSPSTFYSISTGTIGGSSAPNISSLSPASGNVGTFVAIAGTNFGATQGTSTVSFNGTNATVTSWGNTQIWAVVPNGATTGPVVVTVNSVPSNTTAVYTVYNLQLSSVTPSTAQGGATVTLSGLGFGASQGASQVSFNGLAAYVYSWSNTSISVQVPYSATSGPVTVTVGGLVSNSLQFTVGQLFVTSISPSIGKAGDAVTITGTGFGSTQANSTVDFFGMPAAVQSWSNTQIVVTVPQWMTSGSVDVSVGGVMWFGPHFTVTETVQLTDSKQDQSSYTFAMIGGMWVPTTAQGSGCSTCTQRGNISYTYDSAGHALSRTDENGHTTTYTFDSNGNVLTVTVPISSSNSATTTYTYNSFGEVLTATDPMGFVTTNTYDASGNLLSVTTPVPATGTSASVTHFAYNTLGELTSITDPLNNAMTLTYTAAGLIHTITDAQSNVATYGYDSRGNRTSVTDANNQQTTFTYDAMNRLTQITYPDTTTTQFGYDYRGRRTSVQDQNGKTTSYAYDDADRLITVTDAANNVTTYGYDTEDNLTSIQDANQNTTSFSYDAYGRVTQTNFPSGYVETYGYDNVGNLTSKTDRKNQLITYTYDQLNRLTQKSYPDTSTVNYTYDNDSRLTQVTDPTGTYQFTFDNMGRLTGTSTQYAFLTSRTFTASYGYDAASNRVSFTDPENGASSYVYDTLNRLQTLTPPTAFGTGSFGLGYDALSRRTSLTRPNTVNTSYGYDNLSRLLSVTHAKGGVTLDGASYTVDNAGNRTAKSDLYAGVTTNYGYDNIYELLSATQGGSTTESYTYDPVGNRLTALGSAAWSYNTSNELNSRPGVSYAFDYNGNTIVKTDSTGSTSYTWDYENRLTSVTLPGSGGTVSFKYDPWGRRIEKTSPTATSIFAYDGDNLVEEVNASGAAVARYSQGLNIDEPLAMLRSGTTSYYQADGLGSVTSLSNTAGAAAQAYTYDSFGNITATTGSLTNLFRYTGRELDSETTLYYMRARYFDPATGRFVSEDPARFPGGIDFYTYVENDPVGLVDPFGFCPWQVHSRPLKGFPGAKQLGLDHYYFYNSLTGQSIGLGPAGGFNKGNVGALLRGNPVPGEWERGEKPGHNFGPVPDWACNCVDKKAKNPGNPPNYCTYHGNGNANPHPSCPNCFGWVMGVLQDCYNQASAGQQ